MTDTIQKEIEKLYTFKIVAISVLIQVVVGLFFLAAAPGQQSISLTISLNVIGWGIFAVLSGYQIWSTILQSCKNIRILPEIMLTMAVFFSMIMHEYGAYIMLLTGISALLNWLAPILIAKILRKTFIGEFFYRGVERDFMRETFANS